LILSVFSDCHGLSATDESLSFGLAPPDFQQNARGSLMRPMVRFGTLPEEQA